MYLISGGEQNDGYDDTAGPSSVTTWDFKNTISLDSAPDPRDVVITFASNEADDFLPFNVLACWLCCIPIGVVAIKHSLACRDANRKGDQILAAKASRKAKLWCYFTLMLGIFFYIISGFIVAIFMVAFGQIY